MRSVISSIATAAFLLHALFGCAGHAFAYGLGRCSHAESHVEVDSHNHDHDSHDGNEHPETPNPEPHHGHCVFSAMVKVELLKHSALDCPATVQVSTEATEISIFPREWDDSVPFHLAGLRSHLAKSVLLI